MNTRLKLLPIIVLLFSISIAILTHTIRHYFEIDSQFLNLIIASLPNFAAALGLSMIPLIIKSKKPIISTMGITVGLLIYELEQLFTSRTFDINDIIAILLGAIIGYIIIKKSIANERITDN
ncbi:MAG: VanZ family protein [Bacteroidales bacterium]|nr:VanZ family protein [Bacteroidales bacterium]